MSNKLTAEQTQLSVEEIQSIRRECNPDSRAQKICDMALESARLRDALEDMRDAMVRIQQWCEAYPIDVFTEPDWDKAHKVLTENGMTLDGIAAASMRRVLSGVEKISAAALKGTP